MRKINPLSTKQTKPKELSNDNSTNQTIEEIQINKAVKALEAQVASPETEAQAELHARIEIAKADSNKQGVTINTGK